MTGCQPHAPKQKPPTSLVCLPFNTTCTCRVHTPAETAMPGEICQTCNDTTVLRGTLPREPVCTENLIPLIKMLPCRSKVSGWRVLSPAFGEAAF